MIENFEEFVKGLKDIEDQADLTAKLTEVIEHNIELTKDRDTLKTSNEILTEKNQKLVNANSDLFLKVGNVAPEPKTPGVKTPPETIDIEKLDYSGIF